MNNVVSKEEIQILSDSRSLVGYDLGIKYRSEYLIDAYDFGNPVCIIIPDNIFYMSSSFIVGMFEDSTDYFEDIDEFFNHYIFSCNSTMFKYVVHGIKRIYLNMEKYNDIV